LAGPEAAATNPLANHVCGREQELGPSPGGILKRGRVVVLGVRQRFGALYASDQLIIGQRLDRWR
jgi:hypothetical protein